MAFRLLPPVSAFLIAVMLLPCLQLASQPTTPAYSGEINHWNQLRVDYLKSEEGWLNLVGLFWLHPGSNTLGSQSNQQIKLPDGSAPLQAGTLVWENNKVELKAPPSAGFKVDGKAVSSATIYDAAIKKAKQVSIGSLRFTIIERSGKIGVRLRDMENPALKNFPGIDRYAPDTNYRVMARMLPAGPFQTIAITNVLGQTSQLPSPGILVFQIGNQRFTLQCLQEDDQLFILFGDETNGDETYGAGRFLYAAFPDAQGNVLLDFNKAFNPPCAYTPFATCPLPPVANQMKTAITAGEKFEGH